MLEFLVEQVFLAGQLSSVEQFRLAEPASISRACSLSGMLAL